MKWLPAVWMLLNWLQWGRDLSITEIRIWSCQCSGLHSFNGAAIFRSRKSLSANGRPSRSDRASMGPRSFDHGNSGYGDGPVERAALQWGRDLSITEIPYRRMFYPPYPASMGPRS